MKSTKALSILGTRPQIKFVPLIHTAKKDSDIDIQRRLDKINPFGDEKISEKYLTSSIK